MAKTEVNKLLSKLAKTISQTDKQKIRNQLRDLGYYLSKHKK